MKAIKIILGLLIAIIVVVAIVFGVVLNKLDGIVKDAIETAGSSSLQTAVKVNNVSIKLTEGKGDISGLTIANPAGFSNNSLLSLGAVGLKLDLQSVTENVKVIKDVYVNGVVLNAEQKNISDTNIQVLIDNLKKQAGTTKSSESSSSEQDVRLMIESLRIGDSEINLVTEKYGSRKLSLPGYTQQNIGNRAQGLTPEQIGQTIMSTLLSRAKKSVKNELKSIAKEKVDEKLDEEKDRLKDKLKDKAGDKLKNLFN
jgi:uncharacterized protein involved in outer membrane biogenesis